MEGYYSRLAYRPAEDGESGGVNVQLHESGEVEIHEGLVRREIDPSVTEITTKPKATYGKPVREYIAMHKSAALQVELIGNPRKAKEIGIADMLCSANVHGCYLYLEKSGEGEAYLTAIASEAAALLELLDKEVRGEDAFRTLMHLAHSKESAFDLVQKLDDAGLERLFAFLCLVRFGQENTGELDTYQGSVFNRVATEIGTDMRTHWTPSVWFLSRRSAAQLQPVLKASGLSRLFGNGKGYKKGDLVRMVADYFAKVRNMTSPKPDQQQARDWLPEAMQFPAIDPDMVETETEDSMVEDQAEETDEFEDYAKAA